MGSLKKKKAKKIPTSGKFPGPTGSRCSAPHRVVAVDPPLEVTRQAVQQRNNERNKLKKNKK